MNLTFKKIQNIGAACLVIGIVVVILSVYTEISVITSDVVCAIGFAAIFIGAGVVGVTGHLMLLRGEDPTMPSSIVWVPQEKAQDNIAKSDDTYLISIRSQEIIPIYQQKISNNKQSGGIHEQVSSLNKPKPRKPGDLATPINVPNLPKQKKDYDSDSIYRQ